MHFANRATTPVNTESVAAVGVGQMTWCALRIDVRRRPARITWWVGTLQIVRGVRYAIEWGRIRPKRPRARLEFGT